LEISKMPREIYWSENKNIIRILKGTGMLLIPVVLYFVPLEWIKNQHSICLFKNLTGHECIGCGMTRAILSAIHLQFENAFHFNRLFLIVLPILVYIWAKTIINLWFSKIIHFNISWLNKLILKSEKNHIATY
jgi:hypothetical protein